jgi:hypothetical protein
METYQIFNVLGDICIVSSTSDGITDCVSHSGNERQVSLNWKTGQVVTFQYETGQS